MLDLVNVLLVLSGGVALLSSLLSTVVVRRAVIAAVVGELLLASVMIQPDAFPREAVSYILTLVIETSEF